MNIPKYNSAHLQNIKDRFEEKTGVVLNAKQRRFGTRRLIAVICAAAFCLAAAMPVMAANIPGFYEFLYEISPSAAQYFKPVNESDERNGIKMEVVSSYVHGNTAEIYVSLQDLTGDRLDETTDLLDSYSIHTSYDSLLGCNLTEYDEETKTAIFLITVTTFGGEDVAGDKITFSLQEFMSQKKIYEYVNIPVVLGVESTEIQQVEVYGWGGPEEMEMEMELEMGTEKGLPLFTALVPETPRGFSIEGVALTGVGYIDGRLHIQAAIDDNAKGYDYAYFYLADNNGNRVDYSYSFSFNKTDGTDEINYSEDVFDIPLDEIDQYTLYGNFSISGPVTQGGWEVTFYPGEN